MSKKYIENNERINKSINKQLNTWINERNKWILYYWEG